MTGRNRATIYRDIKNGKLSGTRTEKGGWEIDPAEIERVYGPAVASHVADVAPNNKSRIPGNAVSRETFELLQQQLQDRDEVIRDLRADKEDLRRRLDQATAVLIDRSAKPWWRRLLGR